MTYVKQTWANGPNGATPISAGRLNHMEDGIANPADSIDVEVELAIGRMLSRNLPEYNIDHPSWKQTDDPEVDAGPILRRIADAVATESPLGARIVFNPGPLYKFTTAVDGNASKWEHLENLWFEGKGARIYRDPAMDGPIFRFDGCVNTTFFGFADINGGYEKLDNLIGNKRFIQHTSGTDGIPSIGLTFAHCNVRNFTSAFCNDGGATEPPDQDVKNARTIIAFNRFSYCDDIFNVGNYFGARQMICVGNHCYRCLGSLVKTDNDTTGNVPGGYIPIRSAGTHLVSGCTWQEHGRTSVLLSAPTATTGTFTITVHRETTGVTETTGAISVTATAAQVKTAVEALVNVGAGNIDYAKNGPVNGATGVTLLFNIALRYLHVTVTNSTSGGSVTVTRATPGHCLAIAPGTTQMRVEGAVATDLVETRFVRLLLGADQRPHVAITINATIADVYGDLSPIRMETASTAVGVIEADIDIDVVARNLGAGVIDINGTAGDTTIRGVRINAKVTDWASHSYSSTTGLPHAVYVGGNSANTNTVTITGEFHRFGAVYSGAYAIWGQNIGTAGLLDIQRVKVHGPASGTYIVCRVDNSRVLMRNNLWNGHTVDLNDLPDCLLIQEDYGTDGLVTLDSVTAIALSCRGKRTAATRLFRVRSGSTFRHMGCDYDGTFTTTWPIHIDGGTVTGYSYTTPAGQLVASNGVNVNSSKIVNLADGTATNDAVNKSQLDAVSAAAAAPYQAITTSEFRVLDTTSVNVPGLSFPVTANNRYFFEFHVLYDSTTTNDASFSLTLPSGATFALYGAPAPSSVPTSVNNAASLFGVRRAGQLVPGGFRAAGAAAVEVGAVIKGSVIMGGTSGTAQLQARKNVNTDATTPADDLTIYANSLVRAFIIPA